MSAAVLEAPRDPVTGLARSGVMLSAAAGLVGVLSYACTLLMAHLLPVAQYTQYAAAQMIVGIVGIVAHALVPLPLADMVRRHARRSAGRRDAMSFAVLVSLGVGAVAALVSGAVVATFAEPGIALATGFASLVLFAVAPAQGWLQGELRFARYALVSVLEVVARVVFSVAVVLAGAGPAGALIGFAVGGLVLVTGPLVMLRDLAWRPVVLRERGRWSETGDVALVQLVVSVLVGADVVLVALLGSGTVTDAGFQALATLAKGPVYVAAGTVLVVFPVLRGRGVAAADVLTSSLASFRVLALVAAVLLATVPAPLVMLVLPVEYAASLDLAPWLAAAGLGYGAVTVLATVLLAVRRYRRTRAALAVAVVALPVGLMAGWALDGVPGLAAGAAIGALAATAGMAAIAAPALPAGTGRATLRDVLAATGLLGAAWLARPVPVLWFAVAAAAGLFVLRSGRSGPDDGSDDGPDDGPDDGSDDGSDGSPDDGPDDGPDDDAAGSEPATARHARRGLRILHLGFEDPQMPGAGAGSRRTHEINRRLAARGHEVTVLTTRFPGHRDRVQDGVRYVHIGIGAGRNRLTRTAGYALAAVRECRSRQADLVVEDFFVPVSTSAPAVSTSAAAPLWSGRPTVGVVQGLNAPGEAHRYRMPFHLVVRFGVRRHERLVAVCHQVGATPRSLDAGATIEVTGNGIGSEAAPTRRPSGPDVLFVGRLEIAQNGLDLLLRAWELASTRVKGDLVLAGSGPDQARLRDLVEQAGLTERVRFLGWVDEERALELMADARLVAMPSRSETFGVVAVAALATGTPVVAFDIDALREALPAGATRGEPVFDVEAFAADLVSAYLDDEWIAAGAPQARRFAAGYDWDVLAARQEAVYADAAGSVR